MTDEAPKVGPSAGNRGKGRVKGVPNNATKALKDMILGALDDAGGQNYLRKQSIENPTAFMTLIGKVLPTTINADLNGELKTTVINVDTGVPRAD